MTGQKVLIHWDGAGDIARLTSDVTIASRAALMLRRMTMRQSALTLATGGKFNVQGNGLMYNGTSPDAFVASIKKWANWITRHNLVYQTDMKKDVGLVTITEGQTASITGSSLSTTRFFGKLSVFGSLRCSRVSFRSMGRSALTPVAQFTACGKTGYAGPTQAQCTSAYKSKAVNKVRVDQNGIQWWTVPATGLYRMTGVGARGGTSSSYGGGAFGRGVLMAEDVVLWQGEEIGIIVGQAGLKKSGQNPGGGGGATFAFRKTTETYPLLAAGGGSGGHGSSVSGRGQDASTTTVGLKQTCSSNQNFCKGGTAGQGGSKGQSTYSGSGAGWVGNAQDGRTGATKAAFSPRNSGRGSSYSAGMAV